jgi:hypothetical protein
MLHLIIEKQFSVAQQCVSINGDKCPRFLLENQMSLIKSYKSFVASKLAWAEALADALGNKKYLPEAVVESLAEAHAEAYGEKYGETIYFQQSAGGSWYFYSDEACEREQRHDAATKQWQRNVAPYHKVTKKAPSRTSKQVDKVAKKIEQLRAEFTKAELKRIASGITQ